MRFFVSESFTFSFFFWRLFIFHKLLLWKSGFWSKWWLTVFRFLVSLICGIYQLRYLLFPRKMPDFWKERSALFAWSGPQFLHLQAWFRRRQCMVAFGTAGGFPLISGVVSLCFSRLFGKFPAIQLSVLDVWFLLLGKIFFSSFHSVELCLFGFFDADDVVVWRCFCLLLELVWLFLEKADDIFIFL